MRIVALPSRYLLNLPASLTLVLGYLACFLCILLFLELGYRSAQRRERSEGQRKAIDPLDAAVYALMGLLLALTLSDAADRFGNRRELSVKEATAISTAFGYTDIVTEDVRQELRRKYFEYVDVRIRFAGDLNEGTSAVEDLRLSRDLREQLWSLSITGTIGEDKRADRTIVMPALAKAIDISDERTVASSVHAPPMVFEVIFALIMLSAFIAGRGADKSMRRMMLHWVVFAAAITMTVMTLVDLDNPSYGFIQFREVDPIWNNLKAQIQSKL